MSCSNNQLSHRTLLGDVKHGSHLYANMIHSEMGMAAALIFDLRTGLTPDLGEKQTPKPSWAIDRITEIIHLEKFPASNISRGMGSTPVFTVASY